MIDLRERLAPYVEAEEADDVPADDLSIEDTWSEPLLAGATRRVRPLRAGPYQPRHLAT